MPAKNRGNEPARQEEAIPTTTLVPLPPEALELLERAREEMARAVSADMGRVGGILTGHIEEIQQRLVATRAQIDRLHEQTARLQKDPVNELLRQARDRLQGV